MDKNERDKIEPEKPTPNEQVDGLEDFIIRKRLQNQILQEIIDNINKEETGKTIPSTRKNKK